MNDFNLAGSPGQGKKINYQRQYAYTKIVGAHIVVPKPEAPAPAAPAVDERPLWQQIADPAYYEGTDRRGTLVRGRY